MAYALKGVWQECDDDRKQGARWSPACETVKDLYSQLMQMKIDIEYQNVSFVSSGKEKGKKNFFLSVFD